MSRDSEPSDHLASADHPRYTDDLLGHAQAETLLRTAYDDNRLHHAWMFCGPRGIGKATLAHRFARFLLARGSARGRPAPLTEGEMFNGLIKTEASSPHPPSREASLAVPREDPVVRRVRAGGHGDLLTLERRLDERTGKMKNEIVVDDVRAVGHFMSLTASEGGWRIAIIDSADDMNVAAANAVLKILEEPPAQSLLILVSHNPGRLLPTIHSRCRKVRLSPLSDAQVCDLLCARRPDISPEGAKALAVLAEGSVGRALSLYDEGGLDLFEDIAALMAQLSPTDAPAGSNAERRLDGQAVLSLAERSARAGNGESFRPIVEMVQWWLSRIILCAGGKPAPNENLAHGETIFRLSRAAPLDRWLEVWEKINHLIARTDGAHLDRKQVLINIFLQLEDTVRAA